MSDSIGLRPLRLETPLRDLMTPGVVAVSDTASMRAAFEAMCAHQVHAILVLHHASGAPLGWVTTRALLSRADADLSIGDAAQAIDEPTIALPPSATAQEAIERMVAEHASHVAVCRDATQVPEGIVSDIDLVELIVRR
jgi:CBS domain containing-hemolysin-like protein